jgi:dethiobiotin synthetase
MRALAVTGTDTGVGKTVVTAAVAALARDAGQRVAVVKPAQTGVGPDEPGDLAEVRRLGGGDDLHELARYPEPLAPATAARRQGAGGVPAPLVTGYLRTLADRDLVLVEGAGGLLVRFDSGGTTLADLGVPVLLVVRAGLGTLNHAALTCEALRARGLECLGVVVGAWPSDPDLAARCNLADLPSYTGVPLRGVLPDGASRLEPNRFLATARAGLAPELGGDWKGTT